jgi:GNAT superfamily N-acetyltransferase
MDRLETVDDESAKLHALPGFPCVISEDRGGYTVSCDPGRLQPERIHACLTEIYWSKGVDLATVVRSLRHSFCVGVYAGTVQVALTRVITDFTTFAWLSDLYVEKEHQRRGLASWMADFILRHPDLQNLRRFLLASRDARDLYRRFGFTEPRHPERIMERVPGQSPG